ncbi:MAG: M48 family metallopeptidase [Paludibacter sp.]|nr:M48 family metallopeptidase [Paludibacter sp.]
MQKSITLITFLCLCFSLSAQFSDFTYIKSEGEMPKAIIEALKSKSNEARFFSDLVKDGRIIYGSELNRYVNKIADELLKNNRELREKLSIFILKSPQVNATTVKESNIILINIGLLAQARNESELAWIIGHEIAHTTLPKNSKEKVKSLNEFLAYNHGSREEENQADKISFDNYFKNSDYSADAISGVFDVLRYGYLPFDEIPFPKTEVEENFYHFDDKYFLANIKEIRSRDDYVDTLSTHPNVKKREETLLKMIANAGNNGVPNPQGDNLFEKIKNLARFECINYYLTLHIYDKAIYNIFVLQRDFPNNKFLDETNAAAYYGFSKHKTNSSETNTIADYKEVEGEMQQVSYFLNRINKKEANVLAVRKLIYAIKKYPNDDFLNKMTTNILYDLIKENNMSLDDFCDFAQDAQIDTISTAQHEIIDSQQDKQDKYSKIKSKKQQIIYPKEKFKTANYMLVDLKKDSLFLSYYENTIAESEDNEILSLAKSQNAILKPDEKILILYPSFAKYNRDKKEYSFSAMQNSMFRKAIKQSAKSLKISSDIIYSVAKIENTNDFNKMAAIGQWRMEFRQVDFSRMLLYQHRFLQNVLSDNYRYINIALQKSESATFFTGFKWQIFYRAPLCIASVPMDVLLFALPNTDKTLYFALYDIETGETVFSRKYENEGVDSSASINQKLYEFYYILKKGRK